VTRDVVLGTQAGERLPSALIVVVDATNLDNHLRFTLQLIALGLPLVVALNMIDMAKRDGLEIDPERLSAELGVPVVPTVAVRKGGTEQLRAALEALLASAGNSAARPDEAAIPEDISALQRRARAIAAAATVHESVRRRWSHALDGVALHPIAGPILLGALLFVMFQAVFAWSEAPIGWIEGLFARVQGAAMAAMPDGVLRSLIVDGIIAGVGSVVVFLPQILILFLFILLLEASGYMVRAAFLMDRLMAGVGLSGRAFIPLLSSFACAVPGIMATRTIDDPKDRLTTILIAPLMTCSARLPVYAVIIGAFIPATSVAPGIGLQGLVLFGLYVAGIAGAMAAALVLRRTVAKGESGGFMMEMPKYQMPVLRDVVLGLWQRAWIFLRRAGTLIMAATILLWALLSFPQAPQGQSQTEYSAAGRIADGLEYVVRPIGFNHEMALAIIPAMAAREIAVSALATVYSIDSQDEAKAEQSLVDRLRGRWSLPTALAFLMWFVFAPQCLSTIAVMRRETAGWKWPLFAIGYLFGLAYLAAGATFWLATAFGL
jgi:ferrous iron transport protein B